MKLKREQIQRLSEKVLRDLIAKKVVTLRVPEPKVVAKIADVITSDFSAESTLDADARKLLDNYRSQISSGELDEHRAFQMIKKQLAKERKIIL